MRTTLVTLLLLAPSASGETEHRGQVDKTDGPFRKARHLQNSKPVTPTLCSSANKGSCDCVNLKTPTSEWVGMETYTWWVRGQQRCFTVYTPPLAAKPMPVLLWLDCYAKDGTNNKRVHWSDSDGWSKFGGRSLADSRRTADWFGVAWVGLSTPDGRWDFGPFAKGPPGNQKLFTLRESPPAHPKTATIAKCTGYRELSVCVLCLSTGGRRERRL